MKYFLIAFLVTFFLSCTESERKIQQSFYVAGHAYGKPAPTGKKELYPPFKEKFSFLNSKNLSFGVLLGDVVRYPSSWPMFLKN